MKGKLLLLVALVMTFVASAMVHLPIQVMLNYAPLPKQLRLVGASGTLWQGQVQQLHWQSYNLGKVSWQLQSSQLLSGKVQASVRVGQGNPWQLRARGNVGYSLHGAYVENLIGSLPAQQVMKFAPPLPVPLGIDGQLELSIQSLEYAPPYCGTGTGKLVWNTNTIGTPLAELEIGPVIADLSCEDSKVTVAGTQQSEQVKTEFSLELQANRQYNAKAWFIPQEAMPEALSEQLKWLPNPDGQGRYQFSYRGRI